MILIAQRKKKKRLEANPELGRSVPDCQGMQGMCAQCASHVTRRQALLKPLLGLFGIASFSIFSSWPYLFI